MTSERRTHAFMSVFQDEIGLVLVLLLKDAIDHANVLLLKDTRDKNHYYCCFKMASTMGCVLLKMANEARRT